ncbi:TPA: hypothetical protein ACH3X1_000410 [Trebouxia sp. C0004]
MTVATQLILAEDKLEQFADRVQTRILEGRKEKGKPAEYVAKQQQKYCDLQKNAQPFQKFLDKSGGPVCSRPTLTFATCIVMPVLCCFACLASSYNLEWVAERDSDPHISRNAKLHSKDAQLGKDAKKMGPFVKMLFEDMPFECAFVTHYGWVEMNLFSLS